MTREVTTARGTDVFLLVYEDYTTWELTLTSSTRDPSRVGLWDKADASEEAVGYHVPGPWFGDARGFIRRGLAAPGTTLTTATIGLEQVVTLSRGTERTVIRFDIATGIPVSFEVSDSGRILQSHRVTSLQSEGRVIIPRR